MCIQDTTSAHLFVLKPRDLRRWIGVDLAQQREVRVTDDLLQFGLLAQCVTTNRIVVDVKKTRRY